AGSKSGRRLVRGATAASAKDGRSLTNIRLGFAMIILLMALYTRAALSLARPLCLAARRSDLQPPLRPCTRATVAGSVGLLRQVGWLKWRTKSPLYAATALSKTILPMRRQFLNVRR